jgi:hypothetical protein
MSFFIGVIVGVVVCGTIWALLNYDIIELEDDKPKRGKRKAKK